MEINYKEIYSQAFSEKSYSSDYHIQYNYVLKSLKNKFLKDDKFSVIDIGSGRGHLLKTLKIEFPNIEITSVDLANFHNLDFVNKFIDCDITKEEDREKLLNDKYDVLINLDFLEHIEEKYIDDILKTFVQISNFHIIAIANHSDKFNDVELHLIQQSNVWWENEKLNKYFKIINFFPNTANTLYFYELENLILT